MAKIRYRTTSDLTQYYVDIRRDAKGTAQTTLMNEWRKLQSASLTTIGELSHRKTQARNLAPHLADRLVKARYDTLFEDFLEIAAMEAIDFQTPEELDDAIEQVFNDKANRSSPSLKRELIKRARITQPSMTKLKRLVKNPERIDQLRAQNKKLAIVFNQRLQREQAIYEDIVKRVDKRIMLYRDINTGRFAPRPQ